MDPDTSEIITIAFAVMTVTNTNAIVWLLVKSVSLAAQAKKASADDVKKGVADFYASLLLQLPDIDPWLSLFGACVLCGGMAAYVHLAFPDSIGSRDGLAAFLVAICLALAACCHECGPLYRPITEQ